MRKTTLVNAVLLFLLLSLQAVSVVSADVGPKPPTLTFNFSFDVPIQEITGGELYLCEDETCTQFETVELVENSLNIRYSNKEDNCWLFVQGFTSRYIKLRIEFSDKSRESTVFMQTNFDSVYDVEVTKDELIVVPNSEESTPYGLMQQCCFLPALIATIILELVILKIFDPAWAKKISTSSIIFVNIITVPIAWFVIPLILLPFKWVVIIAEFITYVIEIFLLFWVNKSNKITLRESMLASVLMNTASLFFYILCLAIIYS
jgi:hypothetical protein